jgi:hypothetical protein
MLIANVSYANAKPLNIPVVYYKLPNGLKVVISEDHIAPSNPKAAPASRTSSNT